MMRAIAAVAAAIMLIGAVFGYCRQQRQWQAWDAFAERFVQADGRVIDRTAGNRSTSEAQAYGLFFALVANDRQRFDNILLWTANNLARGDLKVNLPSWLWGALDDGSWGIKDPNPASDADLWLAYTLIEAARLWRQPTYESTGYGLLEQIKAREIAEVPGFGLMLLPAPMGFKAEDGSWRFNPSYLPEFQFQWLATVDAKGPWQAIWQNHLAAMRVLMVRGIAPDWYEVLADGRIIPDRKTGGVSSYDAIRVPLWAGMSVPGKGASNTLVALLKPYAKQLSQMQEPPEVLDSQSAAVSGGSPIGFSAAVLPLLANMHEDAALKQRVRLKTNRVEGLLGSPPHYYDQALGMFGEGWDSKRFRFAQDGRLIPSWERSCCDWQF